MSEYVSTVANEMVDPMALVLQEVRDTDTNSDFSELNEVPVGRACTTRPGRVLRVYLSLDIYLIYIDASGVHFMVYVITLFLGT